MKKLFVAAALAYAGFAFAGEYHKGEELKCSQCHTMHASRQHSLRGGSADSTYPIAAQGTGHEKLLIADGVNQTCLACHDNAHYPDVYGADYNTGWNRSAGALNGAVAGHTLGAANPASVGINGVVPSYADWMGHTLGATAAPPGYASATAWVASAGAEGFNCSNCHAVHGSAAFRNAGRSAYMGAASMPFGYGAGNPFQTVGPTYVIGTFDATRDVTVVGTENSFATGDVVFGQGTGGMNAYCAVCHGNFHGSANTTDAAGEFIRHPTTGVARTDGLLVSSTYSPAMNSAQTELVRPSWIDQTAKTFEVGCLTCHKAHGNARGYALLYPSHVGAVTDFENGDADTIDKGTTREYYPIRNLCITCHPMGR